MALSDLAVYSEHAYTAKNEFLDYNIALFNAATEGAIQLRPSAHEGDYSDEVFWKKLTGGAVRRRNAYGNAAIPQQKMAQGVETSVKVAAGTNEVIFEPGALQWIQLNPELEGIKFGEQMAMDSLNDMLAVALGSFTAAIKGVPSKVRNISATANADKTTFIEMTRTAALMGDASQAIRAWVMHSTPATDLLINALTNGQGLFSYGTVNVRRDPLGRIFVVSDAPGLTGAGGTFNTLGLKQGAIKIGENNDFYAADRNVTGYENLQVAYQAQWSFQVGLDGFAWDKASGGHSPNDAALYSTPNWDKIATSDKDVGGVLLISK